MTVTIVLFIDWHGHPCSQPGELLSLAWREESTHGKVPNIMEFLHISTNVRLKSAAGLEVV